MSRSDTATRILDATVAVAARIGLARLSLEDVAREAGVSRQTVYRYFGSRDGLVNAVILREEEQLMERLRAAGERHTELRPAMEAAIVEAMTAAREHPLLDRLLASEPEALLPFLLSGRSPVLDAATPAVAELLAAYVPHLSDDELASVAEATTRLIVSYAVAPPDRPVAELASSLADLLVNGVKH